MNTIEEKLAAIKEINEAKDKVDAELSACTSVLAKNDPEVHVVIQFQGHNCEFNYVSKQLVNSMIEVFQRDLLARQQDLIERAQELMK